MTESLPASPKILSSGWGQMEVENLGRGKDFKLWPGGGKAWDWSVYGTEHRKGIQPGDVAELVSSNCRIVILTTGRLKRLKVPMTTVKVLENQGIKVVVCTTKKGIEKYNEYVEKSSAVGGLFHSTC